MENLRFGKLVIVRDSGQRTKNRQKILECICDCGETHLVRQDSLKSGACTCCKKCRYKKITKHGNRKKDKTSGTYITWQGMKTRCYNPNATDYIYYGGKGIEVHEPWHEFGNFLADLGERPEGMTLERIDGSKNYEPGNVKWATSSEQARNRRHVKLTEEKAIEIKRLLREGKTNKDISKIYGVSEQLVCDIKKGRRWSNV